MKPEFLIIPKKIEKSIYKNISPIQAVINLYIATNDRNNYLPIEVPSELKDLADSLYSQMGYKTNLVKVKQTLKTPKYKFNRYLSICLFTGGKDSLASRIKYEAITRDIKTIHIKGLNTLYPLETSTFRHLSKLNLDIDIVDVKVPRPMNQQEHPLKNLLTHLIAIEYYKQLPKYFNFGFITFENCSINSDINLDKAKVIKLSTKRKKTIVRETKEYQEIEEVLNPMAQKIEVGSPQTSEVLGDGELLSTLSYKYLMEAYSFKVLNTSGMKNTVSTFEYLKNFNLDKVLNSCMSLTHHRKVNHDKTNELYAVEVQDTFVLAGNLIYAFYIPLDLDVKKAYRKSIHSLKTLLQGDITVYPIKVYNFITKEVDTIRIWSELTLEHIEPNTLDYDSEYSCQSCFKCIERYLISQRWYEYSEDFNNRNYRLLLTWIAKADNMNKVNFSYYLIVELKVTKEKLEKLRNLKGRDKISLKTYDRIKQMIT